MPFDTLFQGIEALQQHMRCECQNEDFLYLPLLGKRFASNEVPTEDLATSIRDFIANKNPKRVCALFGDGGSGKSTFLKTFTLKLLNEFVSEQPISLFISLPLLKDPIHTAVEETLRKIGFNDTQIAELKVSCSFIFIFDGYDELHQLQNLYVSNRLKEWNAKTIISCRSQYFYNKEHPNLYFTPIENEREQAHLLQTLYVAPFNPDQIRKYIESCNNSSITIPSYDEIAAIPGLENLITTPFLLKLAVEALPEILARHAASSENERQQLTQTDLYKNFIRRWFERQEQKLKESGHITKNMQDQKPIFWRYCQLLALEMHKHNLSWLNAEDERFAAYFENDAETEMLRSACPVRKTESKMGFWHESLGMHFVAQTIYQETLSSIDATVPQQQVSEIDNIEQERPQGTIHLRLITDDPSALHASADEVNNDSRYKAQLFDVIERSKTNEHYTVGAANAISILNYARVSFSGLNFEGVKISRANLSHANLSQTSFKSATLKDVNFEDAFMYNTDFESAEMTDSQFGRSYIYTTPVDFSTTTYSSNPNIMNVTMNINADILEKKVTCLSAHPNAGYIASIAASRQTVVINVDDSRITKTIEESGKALAISSLHQIAVGYKNGSIRLLNLQSDARINISSQWTDINSLCFSPNGEVLVGSGKSLEHCEITLWNANSGDLIGSLNAHTDLVTSLIFIKLNEEDLLISGSKDATIRVWNLRARECVLILQSSSPVECLAANPISALLISGGDNGKIEYWNLESGLLIGESLYSSNKIMALTLSSDGNILVTGNVNNQISVWQVGNYRSPAYSFTGHGELDTYSSFQELKINSLLFMRNKNLEEYLAVAVDGSLAINFISRRNIEHSIMGNLQGKSDFTNAKVRFDRDSDHQISILDQEGSLIQCDTQKQSFYLKRNYPGKIFYFLEGADAVAAVDNKRLRVFRERDRRELFIFDVPEDVDHYILSNTGKYLITFHRGKLSLWDTQTHNKLLESQINHNKNFQICCFDKSDSYLAIANSSQLLLLWDLNQSFYVRCDVGNCFISKDNVFSMTFSEDHEWLVVHCISSSVVIWNIRSNVLVKTINDQMSLTKIVLSPKKEKLAMIGLSHDYNNRSISFPEHSVVIWDVIEEKYLTVLRHFPNRVSDLTFNVAGDMLLINAPGLQVQLWRIIKDLEYFCYDARLLWSSHSHFYTRGINLDLTRGLTPTIEDLLARRHLENNKTLSGAISAGQYESVVWYINRYHYRPDNQFNSQGNTPLLLAAARGRSKIAALFLRYGVDINFQSERSKSTPLMLAIEKGHSEMALWLINTGADVNIEDSVGYTPLFVAIDKIMIDVITALIDKGADVTHLAQGEDRLTPLKLAHLQNKTDILKLLFSKLVTSTHWGEVINELFQVRASIWVKEYFRNCVALLKAATTGDIRTLEAQIEFGIPINIREKDIGCTPFLLAAGNGKDTAMIRLLELGASLSEVNSLGDNALHIAICNQGHLSTVAYLVETKGIDLLSTQHEGRDGLFLAMSKWKIPMARYLLDQAKKRDITYYEKYKESLKEFVDYLCGETLLLDNQRLQELRREIPEIKEFLDDRIVRHSELENESDEDELLSSVSDQSRGYTAGASLTQPGTTFSRTNKESSNDRKPKCIIS